LWLTFLSSFFVHFVVRICFAYQYDTAS